MTADERLRHKAARQFSLSDVINDAPLPTLSREATVQPKNMNAPLNTRTTLTANASASATADLAATSTVADDYHDSFKVMTEKNKELLKKLRKLQEKEERMDKIKAINLEQAKIIHKEANFDTPLERKPFLSFQEEKPLVSVGGGLMAKNNVSPGFNRPEGYV